MRCAHAPLPLHCPCTAPALPLHCPCTAPALPLHCPCTAHALPMRCRVQGAVQGAGCGAGCRVQGAVLVCAAGWCGAAVPAEELSPARLAQPVVIEAEAA